MNLWNRASIENLPSPRGQIDLLSQVQLRNKLNGFLVSNRPVTLSVGPRRGVLWRRVSFLYRRLVSAAILECELQRQNGGRHRT